MPEAVRPTHDSGRGLAHAAAAHAAARRTAAGRFLLRRLLRSLLARFLHGLLGGFLRAAFAGLLAGLLGRLLLRHGSLLHKQAPPEVRFYPRRLTAAPPYWAFPLD